MSKRIIDDESLSEELVPMPRRADFRYVEDGVATQEPDVVYLMCDHGHLYTNCSICDEEDGVYKPQDPPAPLAPPTIRFTSARWIPRRAPEAAAPVEPAPKRFKPHMDGEVRNELGRLRARVQSLESTLLAYDRICCDRRDRIVALMGALRTFEQISGIDFDESVERARADLEEFDCYEV